MATAEEVLSTMTETSESTSVLVVNSDLRTIAIPPGVALLGVESDEDVHVLHFSMPRYYSGFDLSTFVIRINYRNANKETDSYIVADAETATDEITFSWLVGRNATRYRGTVNFIVCLQRAKADGAIEQEFNTTLASLPVLEGIEVEWTNEQEEEVRDIVLQLLGLIQVATDKADAAADAANSAAANANTSATASTQAADAANIAAEDANTAAVNASTAVTAANAAAAAALAAADVANAAAGANNAGAHNSIYRGKNLGSSVTAAQYAAIAAGTFDDLYIGDYWVIGGVNWRIAAFDYYLRCGYLVETTDHHIVIVPDSILYKHAMNDTNTTAGGYVGSKMYTEGLTQAKTTIKAAFNGHVLNHKIFLTNAVTNGKPSAGAWCDSEIDLMCEQMVYGGAIFMPGCDGTTVPINYRVEKSQLPLFAHRPGLIFNRLTFYLRDVVTNSHFAYVGSDGVANFSHASGALGVRPAFCIR